MVEPAADTRVTLGQQCLIQASGFIADYQRRRLSMRGSQIAKLFLGADGDDRFEVDDPATGLVAVRPSRAPALAPGGDMADWVTLVRQTRPSAAECISMWRDCERFMSECRPAIDAVAAELLVRGDELDYSDASALAGGAMAGRSAPEVPAWARPAPAPDAAKRPVG